MNAVSPEITSGDRIAVSLKVEGQAVDVDGILSIETWAGANRIPRARIVIVDGAPDAEDFPLSESATFVPGAKLVIGAGYSADSIATIHSGTVVRHSIRIAADSTAQLIIETADPLAVLTRSRNSVLAAKTSDSDFIAKLVKAGGGTVGKNEAGKAQHETFIQYHASDWDLILLRAEASGCVVLVDDAKADIVAPTGNDEPVLTLGYGDAIVSLEATIDSVPEYADGAVKGRSWSYTAQKVTEAAASGTAVKVPGNLKPAALADVLTIDTAMAQTGAFLDQTALQDWSTGRLIRAKLAQVRGSARFQGSALVKPGNMVTLSGLGDRFNGNAFVGAVRHLCRDGDWMTTVELGMAPDTFASERGDIAAPPAAGLVPPIRGLHTGQVKQVAQDPSGDYRVLVTLPLVTGEDGVWARLGQFYASKAFGAIFYPEIGDEVVLGFMDEDPANPIILGSVYSSPRAPTYPPNDANDKKAIVTRQKMEITFDDKDIVLEIRTPGGRIVRLDDKAKEVKITDPFGNYVLMAESKVDIFSAAAMNITSTGDMTIKSNANMSLKAVQNMNLEALQIAGKAQTKCSFDGAAQAELTSGAQITIKAALVMIN